MKKRILLVEDEDTNMMYFRLVLEPISALTFCYNGKEAWELFNTQSFDIIITDLQMPVMSGYDLIKKIRKENKEIPIIVATAYALGFDLERVGEIGGTDYIIKPVKTSLLLKSVFRHLNIEGDVYELRYEIKSIFKLSDDNQRLNSLIDQLLTSIHENNSSKSEETKLEINSCINSYLTNKELLIQMKDSISKSIEAIYKEVYFEFMETENLVDKLKLIQYGSIVNGGK